MAKFNPADYSIIFSTPEYLVPTDWTRYIPFGMFLVDVLRPNVLVALGIFSTVPYSTVCQTVTRLQLTTRCFGVDPWQKNAGKGDLPEQKAPFELLQHLEHMYGEFSTVLQDNYQGAEKHFQDGTVDLLLLGADDQGNAPSKNFEAWLPKMSDQGVILIHDSCGQYHPANRTFWEKVKAEYPSFEIAHEHGLGVLVVGKHPPERLQQTLLDMDEMIKIQVRDFFLQLGNLLVPLFDLQEKDTELELLRAKSHQFEQSNHILRYEKRILAESVHEAQVTLAARTQGSNHRTIDRLLPPGSSRRKFAGNVRAILRGLFPRRQINPSAALPIAQSIEVSQEEKEILDAENTSTHEKNTNDQPYKDVYLNLLSRTKGVSNEYVPLAETDYDPSGAPTQLIAFYLPQFHPIPENDKWWGRGFTEWSNVSKAVPNFAGHYQPRLPGELNFYDLRLPDIQKRQVELAQKYGVHGFCFYYYWFNGKRLLDLPLNHFIENRELDFPFCICWGNENWTRRWDGAENHVLIGQTHTEEEYAAFLQDVAPILLHDRYIRINGKPLLAVYRVNLLPNPQRAVQIWREEARSLGVGEIYLAAVQSFDIEDPRTFDFDCAIEFPPHNCLNIAAAVDPLSLNLTNKNFAGNFFDYRAAADLMINKPVPDYIKFKTVMPSWDNTARRQNDSVVFLDSSPAVYRNWLKRTIQYTGSTFPPGMRYIFINAWNEWAEGAYLEPDRHYGYAYLQATRDALEGTSAL